MLARLDVRLVQVIPLLGCLMSPANHVFRVLGRPRIKGDGEEVWR